MKILISPAKSFKKNEGIETEKLLFPEKTEKLVKKLKKYTMNQMGNLNRTNDKLTEKAYYDYQEMDLENLNNPAIFAYDGLVFKQFDKQDFDDLDYLNDHVYIISALWGLAKPLTGISDYRLYFDNSDMDLYEYWSDDLYKEVYKDGDWVLSLASKEYTKTIKPYLGEDDVFINIDFKDDKNGKLRSYTAYMKQMRGRMLKYLITNKIDEIDEIKTIRLDGYSFDESVSTDDNLVFVRRNR